MDDTFLIKNHTLNSENHSLYFYQYTSETAYFLNHLPDTGGFSSNELEDVEKQKLAVFSVHKCEKDSKKLVGELCFYGIGYNYIEIDTLIYKCN